MGISGCSEWRGWGRYGGTGLFVSVRMVGGQSGDVVVGCLVLSKLLLLVLLHVLLVGGYMHLLVVLWRYCASAIG